LQVYSKALYDCLAVIRQLTVNYENVVIKYINKHQRLQTVLNSKASIALPAWVTPAGLEEVLGFVEQLTASRDKLILAPAFKEWVLDQKDKLKCLDVNESTLKIFIRNEHFLTLDEAYRQDKLVFGPAAKRPEYITYDHLGLHSARFVTPISRRYADACALVNKMLPLLEQCNKGLSKVR